MKISRDAVPIIIFICVFILLFVVPIVTHIKKSSRVEVKREVVGTSFEEGQYDTMYIHSKDANFQVVKNPDTYYLIVKITYDNGDIEVSNIKTDKDTYLKY